MSLDISDIKVLILEDQRSVRGLLVNTLKTLGIGTVIGLISAEEVIEHIHAGYEEQKAFGSGAVNAVLLDIVLEDANFSGLELADWIRSNPQCPSPFLPIMMFSALATMRMVQRSRDLGVNVFMRKPFAVDNLTTMLMGLLRDQRSFLKTDSYFGPDRRRRGLEEKFDGQDRRCVGEKSSEVKVFKRAAASSAGYALKETDVAKAEVIFQDTVNAAVDDLMKRMEELNALYNIFAKASMEMQALKKTDPAGAEAKSSQMESMANQLLDIMVLVRLDLGVFRVPLLSDVAQNLSEFVCEIAGDPLHAINRDSIALIEKFINFMIIIMKNMDTMNEKNAKAIISELQSACSRFERKYIKNPISQELLEERIRLSIDRLKVGCLASEMG